MDFDYVKDESLESSLGLNVVCNVRVLSSIKHVFALFEGRYDMNRLLRFRPWLVAILIVLLLLLASQTALAAIAYEDQATNTLGTDGTQLIVNCPSGTAQGDLLLAAVSTDGSVTFNTPAGWTLINQGQTPQGATPPMGANIATLAVFYKVAGASEPSSYTFTWSDNQGVSGQQAAGAILRYSGIDTSDPINASNVGTGTNANPTAPSVTTDVNGAMIVRIYGADDSDMSGTPYPSGHTGRLNIRSSTTFYGDCSLGVADVVQSTAGSTGSAQFQMSASEEWRAVTVALTPAIAQGGTLRGTLFRDLDADGSRDSREAGVADIIVTAYDVTGTAVLSTTTGNSTGAYTLTGLTDGTTYRLEFTGLPSYLQPGPVGADCGTTVIFATCPDTGFDVGVANPADYCQSDPKLVTSVYRQNDNTGSEQVLGSFDYSASGRSPDPATEATASQIGTTYGLAYQRSSDTLFAAAYQKRHAGYGSADSTGAIYQIPNPGDGSPTGVSLFVNLNTLYGSDVAGTNPHPRATTVFTVDGNSWDAVGKVAFGDMDISEDELSLWTVNLNDRQLYHIPLGSDPTNPTAPTSPAQIDRYPLADPTNPLPDLPSDCTNDVNYVDIRPFATKVHDGLVYVGLVCSGESTQLASTLKALAYSFDPGTETFAKVLEFDLDYERGWAMRYPQDGSGTNGSANWNYWEPNYSTSVFAYTYQSTNGWEVGYAQPMFSDIEFDEQGNMLVGLRDRFGDQFGYRAPDPNGYYPVANGYRGDGVGDILRATPDGGGGWALSIVEATDGTEFFPNDYFDQVALHEETSVGGLAAVLGKGEVAVTVFDPILDSTGNWAGGVAWMNTSTGARPSNYQVYDTDNNGADPATFGKAHGVGDLEALCDAAPIEIGNRVWEDTDEDGIQDSDESAIAGVVVGLYDSMGTLIVTTTTGTDGSWYFDSTTVPTLTINMTYTVGVLDSNFTSGGPLDGFSATALNANPGGLSDPELRDSDGGSVAVGSGGDASGLGVQIVTGGAGHNNHTYDFGFYENPTAVELISLTAAWDGDQVLVAWGTATEVDTVGFNIWRSTSPDGGYVQVNDALIPAASLGNVWGGSYTYTDSDVVLGTTYTYKLEELEIGGRRNWYGPVSTDGNGAPAVVKLLAFAARRWDGVALAWAAMAVAAAIVTLVCLPRRHR